MPLKINITGYGILYPELSNGSKKRVAYDRNNVLSDVGHILSRRSKSKLRNLFTSLFCRSSTGLKLFTFTLPSGLKTATGREIYAEDSFYISALGKLLSNLRKNYNLRNYFWVAERQMKREQGFFTRETKEGYLVCEMVNAIHFHCIFECDFISVQRVAYLWSNLLKDVHRPSKNCVNVKRIFNIKTLSSYVANYVTKNTEPVYGRIWGCSREYSDFLRKSSFVLVDEIDHALSLAQSVTSRTIDCSSNFKMNVHDVQYDMNVLLENYHTNFGIRTKPNLKGNPLPVSVEKINKQII